MLLRRGSVSSAPRKIHVSPSVLSPPCEERSWISETFRIVTSAEGTAVRISPANDAARRWTAYGEEGDVTRTVEVPLPASRRPCAEPSVVMHVGLEVGLLVLALLLLAATREAPSERAAEAVASSDVRMVVALEEKKRGRTC